MHVDLSKTFLQWYIVTMAVHKNHPRFEFWQLCFCYTLKDSVNCKSCAGPAWSKQLEVLGGAAATKLPVLGGSFLLGLMALRHSHNFLKADVDYAVPARKCSHAKAVLLSILPYNNMYFISLLFKQIQQECVGYIAVFFQSVMKKKSATWIKLQVSVFFAIFNLILNTYIYSLYNTFCIFHIYHDFKISNTILQLLWHSVGFGPIWASHVRQLLEKSQISYIVDLLHEGS